MACVPPGRRPGPRLAIATCGLGIWLASAGEARADTTVLDRRVTPWDWNLDPPVLVTLAMMTWLYVRGWSRVRRPGRRPTHLGTAYHMTCFVIGIAVLAVVLVSPLDPMSDQLASAHMVQHMLMMTVAAPLLVIAATWQTCFCGLPPLFLSTVASVRNPIRKRTGDLCDHPQAVWWTYAITMWAWHLPALYRAALRNPSVHDLQHLTFFVSACAFWQLSLAPRRSRRVHDAVAVLLLFTTTLHATVLGVLMTVAPRPWYPEFFGRTERWGWTPLEDQQLAGLIMWMPACASYLLVAIGVFARTVRQTEQLPPKSLWNRPAVR